MLYAVSGHSEDIDTASALNEIIEKCQKKMSGQAPKAGLLFAGIDAEHEALLDGINKTWPGIQLIGCTTDGELSSDIGFHIHTSFVQASSFKGFMDITAPLNTPISFQYTGCLLKEERL